MEDISHGQLKLIVARSETMLLDSWFDAPFFGDDQIARPQTVGRRVVGGRCQNTIHHGTRRFAANFAKLFLARPNPLPPKDLRPLYSKGARGGFPPVAAHRLKSLARGSSHARLHWSSQRVGSRRYRRFRVAAALPRDCRHQRRRRHHTHPPDRAGRIGRCL